MTDLSRTAGDDSAEDDGEIVLLHVEPDGRSTELLAAFAERFADGFAVRSVDEMGAALDAADAVDSVVTEQRLPDGSGVALVERLRADRPNLPIVFHTTCRSEDAEAKAFAAGADAYFEKRSERGQYGCLLDRVRALVDGDDAGRGPAATTVSENSLPSTTSVETPSSEE